MKETTSTNPFSVASPNPRRPSKHFFKLLLPQPTSAIVVSLFLLPSHKPLYQDAWRCNALPLWRHHGGLFAVYDGLFRILF